MRADGYSLGPYLFIDIKIEAHMSTSDDFSREGSLAAPTRHPLAWREPDFYAENKLMTELERVFDICHGCRRCFNLCHAFPTLFDAIDASSTLELDGVDKKVYWEVVDHCYLCDMCFMSKCPYVPPHEWNVDFPHLMLRAKAVKFNQGKTVLRDKILANTDAIGQIAAKPVVAPLVNWVNRNSVVRRINQSLLGLHPEALLPPFNSNSFSKRSVSQSVFTDPRAGKDSRHKVLIFSTCYGKYNEPDLVADLVNILHHNKVAVAVLAQEQCCGMPRLELGDFAAIEKSKTFNVEQLQPWVEEGWQIMAPVPSCVLMFKQELPLIFPEDNVVQRIQQAILDPFQFLLELHKQGALNTQFKNPLGKISYHVACHLRVQNIGLKTKEVLQLVPNTQVDAIERCSGHNGTYAVKVEFHKISMKIGKPVVNRVEQANADHYSSDCPMAGHQIENGLRNGKIPEHPLRLLRHAYGI